MQKRRLDLYKDWSTYQQLYLFKKHGDLKRLFALMTCQGCGSQSLNALNFRNDIDPPTLKSNCLAEKERPTQCT